MMSLFDCENQANSFEGTFSKNQSKMKRSDAPFEDLEENHMLASYVKEEIKDYDYDQKRFT